MILPLQRLLGLRLCWAVFGGLLVGLSGCGDVRDWRLNLVNFGALEPDLVVIIRMDDPSRGQDPNQLLVFEQNEPGLPPDRTGASFESSDYSALIRGCALERGLVQDSELMGVEFNPPSAPCEGLAEYFGSTVFAGEGFVRDPPQESSSLRFSEDTSFAFVLIFFGQQDPDRDACLQLEGVEVLSSGFRVQTEAGFEVTTSLDLSIGEPTTSRCFPLFDD